MKIATQLKLKTLSELFDEIATLISYPHIEIEYVSGTSFKDCIINAGINEKTQLSEILASRQYGLALRDFVYDFLGIYCMSIIQRNVDIEFADNLFSILSRYFIQLEIKELYVPVAIIKTNKKHNSSFVQYGVCEVPRKYWGDKIASTIAPLLTSEKFTFVMNGDMASPYMDDPYKAYVEFISVLARCIIFGQINEITTSD